MRYLVLFLLSLFYTNNIYAADMTYEKCKTKYSLVTLADSTYCKSVVGPNNNVIIPKSSDCEDEDFKHCANIVFDRKENKEVCKELDEEAKALRLACGKIGGDKKDCIPTLNKCSKCSSVREKGCKSCAFMQAKSKDELKTAADDAKEKFEDGEEKLQDLQDEIKEKQEDSLKDKQSTEEKLQTLKQDLANIPEEAKELALQQEAKNEEQILNFIDQMNTAMDGLNDLSNRVTDAENRLTDKRKELLDTCETKAREYQAQIKSRQDSQRATRTNYVNTISQAIQTSRAVNCKSPENQAKKQLRSACTIKNHFSKCQKARMYQTGLAQAKRAYKREMSEVKRAQDRLKKDVQQLENRLASAMKLQTKAAEIALNKLATKQRNLSSQIMMLQQQQQQNMQLAQQQMSQMEQQMQQKQYQQYQDQTALVSATYFKDNAKAHSGGTYDEDDIKMLDTALAIAKTHKTSFEQKYLDCGKTEAYYKGHSPEKGAK